MNAGQRRLPLLGGLGGLGAGIAAGAALIAVITLVARAAGFGRWLVYSDAVSAQCVGNAYSTANLMPNVLFEVVAGGALAGAVVPLLAGPLARAREPGADPAHAAEADRTASALVTWAVLALAPVALVLAAAATPLIGLMNLDSQCPGASALAARMLVVFAPQVVLYGLGVVLAGILLAHHRFVWPALGPLLSSLVVMGAYLAFAHTAAGSRDDARRLPAAAESWLAWGTTAGVVAMTVPLLLPVHAAGVRLRPTLRFPDGVGRRAASLAGAGVLTLLAQQTSVVAVLVLSNGPGTEATLNVFQYTQAVYLLPYALLVVPLATSAFPRLAASAATGQREAFAATAARTTRAVLLVACAGAAVLAALAWPVAAFFARLDSGQVTEMGPALVAMAPGLIGFALVAHVGRALYALERGRLAATATVTGWLVVVLAMILLSVLVSEPADVAVALAGGSSIGMTVAGAGLLVALRRAAGSRALAGLWRTLVGTGIASLLAAAAGWWVSVLLTDALASSLGGTLAAGVVAAGTAGAALGAGVAVLDRPTWRSVRDLRRRTRGPADDVQPAAKKGL